ncbi:MAG: LamG domain-containing protein [Sphingobacteriia bacterium]
MKNILIAAFLGLFATAYGQGSGHALSLDGNDGVNIPDNNVLDFGSNDFSYELWVRPRLVAPGSPVGIMQLLAKRVGGQPNFELQMLSNGTYLTAIVGGAAGPYADLYMFESGVENVGPVLTLQPVWNHVCFTRNNGTAFVYVNGELKGTKAMPFDVSSAAPLFLGSDSGSEPYSGMLDEVRFWNRALTEAEIRHRMTERLTGTEPGLVAYYRMDEGADNTCPGGQDVCDASGNGNHGVKF